MKKFILILTLVLMATATFMFSSNHSKNKVTSPDIMADNQMAITNDTEDEMMPSETRTTLIAGGCFWCVEADIEKLPGVLEGVSGYAEGTTKIPLTKTTVKRTSRSSQVTYDPQVVTFTEIAIYAIKHMDPTDGEGSFFDRGPSYAPALYYETEAEKLF